MREAIWQAVLEEMHGDKSIFVWGEGERSKLAFDYPKLLRSFHQRILSMPIAEASIVAAGLGAAIIGLKPIIDLSFDDLSPRVMDEILNHVAKARFVTGGQNKPAMIIKMDLPPVRCAQTGQRLESLFARIPGLVICVPSTPYDAKGLMKASIRSGDVVIMIEDRWITTRQPVPLNDYEVEFGKAAIRREGEDVTIVTYGYMALQAMEAAEMLGSTGVNAEVVDLRTLAPLDLPNVFKSVEKTGKVIILEGGWKSLGIGAELSALITEHAMHNLDSPPLRLAAKMTHIPTSSALRMKVFPETESIVKCAENLVANRARITK